MASCEIDRQQRGGLTFKKEADKIIELKSQLFV